MPKPKFGSFKVFGRRFGKWKPVGVGRTKKEAFSLGKKFARTTLGRSFFVPGVKSLKLPGFKTKKEKGKGLIYIQKTGKGLRSTLGSRGEKAEIKFFRRSKPKSKSKKRKRKGGFDLW